LSTLATLTKEQLKAILLRKNWRPEESFHLYIHGPFCPTQCTFCKHQGLNVKIGSDLYSRYYEEYLPNLIESFADVIRSYPLQSVYFGGGTSSMMTTDIMVETFASIPDFAGIPHKTFECNPSLMTEEKIDLLGRYGFTYVSFGVQTFDPRILAANNRPSPSVDRLSRLARLVRDRGIVLNCDLITFIDKQDCDDLRQLEADLDMLASDIQPDVITVYPETFVLRGAREAEQLMMVGSLQVALANFESRSNGRYRISDRNKEKFFSVPAIRERLTMDYRMFKSDLSSEGMDAVRSYNCSGGKLVPANQTTLGLGSLFGEKDPAYTYIGKDFYCAEVNQDWSPVYHVKRDETGVTRAVGD